MTIPLKLMNESIAYLPLNILDDKKLHSICLNSIFKLDVEVEQMQALRKYKLSYASKINFHNFS
jgi:hypothetical protein